MTINDVMIREIAEAERAEREAEVRKQVEGERLIGCACAIGVMLCIILAAFLAWCAFARLPHVYPADARRGNFFYEGDMVPITPKWKLAHNADFGTNWHLMHPLPRKGFPSREIPAPIGRNVL